MQRLRNSKAIDFGEASTSATSDRLGYIADDCLVAENDIESGLGDFGVRKYDNRGGRFLSIDRSHSRGWDKYLAWMRN